MLALLTIVADLEWSAPQGCPGPLDMEQTIESMLADPSVPRVRARGSIRAQPRGFALDLQVGEDVRELSGPDCAALASAAALIIAVAHDPVGVAVRLDVQVSNSSPAPTAATPTVVDTVGPTPSADPTPSPSHRPPASSPRPHEDAPPTPRGLARLQLGLSGGVMPRLAPGLGLGLGLTSPRGWRVEATAMGFLPSEETVDSQTDLGARLWWVGGALRGCGVPAPGRWEIPLCAGMEMAGLGGRGRGPGVRSTTRTQLWVGAIASAGAVWKLRPWFGIALRAEASIGIRRPGVHLDGIGPVFRAGPGGARAWFGPELRFP